MINKTRKVVWFTFTQVITSNWFSLITILGIVGLLFGTQYDKLMKFLSGNSGAISNNVSTTMANSNGSNGMFIVQFMIVFILFILILMYGSNIANSIVEEKSGRIIETLLCYVKPLELLSGKILGYVLGICVQISVWVGYYFVLATTIEMPDNGIFNVLSNLGEKAIILMTASIILGFIMYAFAFAALASFADNAQDSTQLMMPVGIVILGAYFVSLASLNGVDGIVMDILSYAPFFSSIVIFVTSDLVNLTLKELLIAVGIQAIEAVVIAIICSNIYRRGVISYGLKKLSFSRTKK